jgi:outer membrane protein TolC
VSISVERFCSRLEFSAPGAIQNALSFARRSSWHCRALLAALEGAYNFSELRYKQGLDGYLSVAVAQQSLYAARQGTLATRLSRQSNQITLDKALGGQL